MKLSQLESLSALTVAQKSEIVYGGSVDDGKSGEVALLLGGKPEFCPERAKAAAELYHKGRVRYIMPTGGVEWEHENGEVISEAYYMTRMLRELGVPEEAILIENEARTTKENMIYGTLQINRRLRLENVRRVIVVTSTQHLRRSVSLAKWLFPRTVAVSGYPAYSEPGSRENWYKDENIAQRGEKELTLLKKLIDSGLIDDIEF